MVCTATVLPTLNTNIYYNPTMASVSVPTSLSSRAHEREGSSEDAVKDRVS